MLETKTFEIRDRGTFIPVMATAMAAVQDQDAYLLSRAGYGTDYLLVMLCKLDGQEISYTPESWRAKYWRTLVEAHKYITKNWGILASGQVIDVEFILGETTDPKISERFTC